MIEGIESNYKEQQARDSSRSKLGFVLAGLGVGGTLAYLIARRARAARRVGIESRQSYSPEDVVDDKGTTQDEAAQILRNLRDRGFESSDEKLAVALGRTAEEIQGFVSGREVIDNDIVMKARGVAMHRGIRVG